MDKPVDHPVARRHVFTPEELALASAKAVAARKKPGDKLLQEALSRVDPARHAQISKIALSCPRNSLRSYLSAATGKCGPTEAIKCMCFHCVGWENARFEVANCTARGCPLWAYRPVGPEGDDLCQESGDGHDLPS